MAGGQGHRGVTALVQSHGVAGLREQQGLPCAGNARADDGYGGIPPWSGRLKHPCPFAGMTRIRFKGSPRSLAKRWPKACGISAPHRSSPRNRSNVGRCGGVSTRLNGNCTECCRRAFPGRCAARNGALQSRGPSAVGPPMRNCASELCGAASRGRCTASGTRKPAISASLGPLVPRPPLASPPPLAVHSRAPARDAVPAAGAWRHNNSRWQNI